MTGAVAEMQEIEGEEVPTGVYVIKVQNSAGVTLPHTGGVGTNMIYLLGILLIGIAGAGLVMRRKKSASVPLVF